MFKMSSNLMEGSAFMVYRNNMNLTSTSNQVIVLVDMMEDMHDYGIHGIDLNIAACEGPPPPPHEGNVSFLQSLLFKKTINMQISAFMVHMNKMNFASTRKLLISNTMYTLMRWTYPSMLRSWRTQMSTKMTMQMTITHIIAQI